MKVFYGRGGGGREGGLRAPETMSPLGVIKPKCDEKQQGEGGGS